MLGHTGGQTLTAEEGERTAEDLQANVHILIRSVPPGADVWLDGNKLAEKAPVAVARPRDKTEHVVKLSLGKFSKESQFKYGKGPLTILEEQVGSGEGELAIYGKPSGLKARVDGRAVGTTPMSIDVAPGEHEVVLGGGEYEQIKRVVVVKLGEKTEINPIVPKRGRLSTIAIDSEPEAEIHIDGAARGRTNGEALPLEAGVSHKVTLVVPGEARREFPVKLAPGERRRMFLDLRKRS